MSIEKSGPAAISNYQVTNRYESIGRGGWNSQHVESALSVSPFEPYMRQLAYSVPKAQLTIEAEPFLNSHHSVF